MELLDRYLQAVRFWLPRKQQDDIIAELGDDLRSQVEERESALGRPLNEDELVALLKQAGHPLWVAGRYQKQQALIGPVLFPLYSFVLKIVMLGYLGPWLVTWVVLTVFVPSHRAPNPALTLAGGWASFCANVFVLFGFVTLVFAVLERFQSAVSALQQWDPRKLPRMAHRKERVSRVESVFGLVFSVVLYCLVALASTLRSVDIWTHCEIFLTEPGSLRLVSSPARAAVHCRGAAMREHLAPAVDLASRRRSATFRFHCALYLCLFGKVPSLLDTSRDR
jgi:hypothetical protein